MSFQTLHSTARSRRRLMRGVALCGLIGLVVLGLPPYQVKAAALATPRDYMNRQQVDLGASGDVQHEIFFTPTTSLGSGGKVKLTFPAGASNNSKWCRTTGSDPVVTAITEPSGLPSGEGSVSGLPGTLGGSCTQSPDVLIITFTGNMVGGTRYGVRIANGTTMKLGTASSVANDIKVTLTTTTSGDVVTDTNVFALSIITATPGDQYTINATIDPTLTVALSNTTVNLSSPTGLDATHVNFQGVTSTVTTNAKTGYVSMVNYSGVMTNGTDNIIGTGGTATAGTAGFGAATSQLVSGGLSQDNASCTVSEQQGAGPYNASSLSATFQKFASSATPKSSEPTTLCFLLAIAATTPPGTYTTTVTLVTTAKF